MKKSIIISILLLIIIFMPIVYYYYDSDEFYVNQKPVVDINYPNNGATVSKIVLISGTASDLDSNDSLLEIEVNINGIWYTARGNTKWIYEWNTYDILEGIYTIIVRSWDGLNYSEEKQVKVLVDNPEIIKSDEHKWAIFIIAYNFPQDNESKLGNGALYLAEEMASYFIENLKYSTDNIIILFDDGWIRSNNGLGKPIETLQERKHEYDISYAGATKENVNIALNHIVEQSNKYQDSEVFIWISSHGCGDSSKKLFGGKIFKRSGVFLWDDTLDDNELGILLMGLKSKKTCVIVDACYSGGFADKTIFNFPEFFLLKSNLPESGRVIISGASKYRLGWTSNLKGPIFSQIWFNGIKSGSADGYKSFILNIGRPTKLNFFKDGKVSVEEAFFYTRYILRTDNKYKDFSEMEPQINDQYPNKGFIFSQKGLILGE